MKSVFLLIGLLSLSCATTKSIQAMKEECLKEPLTVSEILAETVEWTPCNAYRQGLIIGIARGLSGREADHEQDNEI